MLSSESPKPAASTSELVMKICLMASIAVGGLLLILAAIGGGGGFVKVTAGVIPVIAIQWVFYLAVKARQPRQ